MADFLPCLPYLPCPPPPPPAVPLCRSVQVDYVLGDCGRSWLVGFGEKYPQYLHQEHSYNSILVWPNDTDPLGVRIPAT